MTKELKTVKTEEKAALSFLKMPKMLFSDERFSHLSIHAKVLYSVMLERASLSAQNGWVDGDNRVYIIFTLKEAMKVLLVGKDKCLRVFSELDTQNGCGLITKKRQGMGKPLIIYVMNPEDVAKCEVKTSENENPDTLKNRSQDFSKSESNKININNTNYNNTEYNKSYHIIKAKKEKYNADDEMRKRKAKKDEICNKIDYDVLTEKYSQHELDMVVDIMTDCFCSEKKYMTVGGEKIPIALICERLLKLDSDHIEYVLDCVRESSSDVGNIRAYILTALYNAYLTMEYYYERKVRRDLDSGG